MSKNLYNYLKKHGGLHNPRLERQLRKRYRRNYQNAWARKNRLKRHEVRFTLNKEEYGFIKTVCQSQKTTPSKLAKDLLVGHSKAKGYISRREDLLAVARHLGLAINRLNEGGDKSIVLAKLMRAEDALLTYLKN